MMRMEIEPGGVYLAQARSIRGCADARSIEARTWIQSALAPGELSSISYDGRRIRVICRPRSHKRWQPTKAQEAAYVSEHGLDPVDGEE